MTHLPYHSMVLEAPTPPSRVPTPNTMRQMMFLEGAKDLILNQHPFPNKAQTLLIFLFTGMMDNDLDRVRWALDNGADANMAIAPWAVNIMRTVGWNTTSYFTVQSPVSALESEQTLSQYDEPGPDSEASQEAI